MITGDGFPGDLRSHGCRFLEDASGEGSIEMTPSGNGAGFFNAQT